MYCQNGKVVQQDPVTPDADGNCPRNRFDFPMWACGDGTCVIESHLCDYNLAPLCPDFSDLLYCRIKTAEMKDRGCRHRMSNAYRCLDRSLKYDSGVPVFYYPNNRYDDEDSKKNETEKRRVPNSPPNCMQKGRGGEKLYPCTGYYPNTCGTKDVCRTVYNLGVCTDYSSYTCLSKSKAEDCRDIKDTWIDLPYFKCNKSGYYKTNQIIQRVLKVLHDIYCFYLF